MKYREPVAHLPHSGEGSDQQRRDFRRRTAALLLVADRQHAQPEAHEPEAHEPHAPDIASEPSGSWSAEEEPLSEEQQQEDAAAGIADRPHHDGDAVPNDAPCCASCPSPSASLQHEKWAQAQQARSATRSDAQKWRVEFHQAGPDFEGQAAQPAPTEHRSPAANGLSWLKNSDLQ